MVVDVGDTLILAVVGPVFHVIVLAPLAVSVVLPPEQIVVEVGVIVNKGRALTVTVVDFVFTHPVTVFVPVTV